MSITMLQRLPVADPITQRYGVNPTEGVVPNWNGTLVQQLVAQYGNYQPDGHDGTDFGCALGTIVYPAGPGRVDFAGLGQDMPEWAANKWAFIFGPEGWASGNIVLIDHGGGLGTYYAHGRAVLARSGQGVGIYDPILRSGGDPDEQPGSGRSGGPHLHASAVLFDQVWTTRNYGRINILSRIPAGITIPVAPGASGAPATEDELLIPGVSELHIQ